jgi:hypothetical protein
LPRTSFDILPDSPEHREVEGKRTAEEASSKPSALRSAMREDGAPKKKARVAMSRRPVEQITYRRPKEWKESDRHRDAKFPERPRYRVTGRPLSGHKPSTAKALAQQGAAFAGAADRQPWQTHEEEAQENERMEPSTRRKSVGLPSGHVWTDTKLVGKMHPSQDEETRRITLENKHWNTVEEQDRDQKLSEDEVRRRVEELKSRPIALLRLSGPKPRPGRTN